MNPKGTDRVVVREGVRCPRRYNATRHLHTSLFQFAANSYARRRSCRSANSTSSTAASGPYPCRVYSPGTRARAAMPLFVSTTKTKRELMALNILQRNMLCQDKSSAFNQKTTGISVCGRDKRPQAKTSSLVGTNRVQRQNLNPTGC